MSPADLISTLTPSEIVSTSATSTEVPQTVDERGMSLPLPIPFPPPTHQTTPY